MASAESWRGEVTSYNERMSWYVPASGASEYGWRRMASGIWSMGQGSKFDQSVTRRVALATDDKTEASSRATEGGGNEKTELPSGKTDGVGKCTEETTDQLLLGVLLGNGAVGNVMLVAWPKAVLAAASWSRRFRTCEWRLGWPDGGIEKVSKAVSAAASWSRRFRTWLG